MAEDIPSRPKAPTDQVAKIRRRQRRAMPTAMIGVFLGVIIVGAWATLTFNWPEVAALPTIVAAFLASMVAVMLVGEPYDRRISRLWKKHNEASDRYWAQRQRPT